MQIFCPACNAHVEVETFTTVPAPCPNCGQSLSISSLAESPAPTPGGGSAGGLPAQFGRYRVTAELGAGSFGKVYKGYDEELRRDVAIKVPHRHRVVAAKDVEAYLREARILASLDHPGIVPVYDFGRTDDGLCYVVSKFVQGTDLKTRIATNRPSYAGAVRLVIRVAEGLHHAHQAGLVHRDIKPANLLVDGKETPYVADFGLALKAEDFGKQPGILGTPRYMSPEQRGGDGHLVDARSDVYSLGAVFYELLTGKPPFRANSLDDLLEQIQTLEPRPPRQLDDRIPRDLDRICLKALAKRVTERYSTAIDLAEDLRAWETAQAGHGPAVPAAAPTEPPSFLKDLLLSFEAFISDRTQDFVGRGFVFEALEEFTREVPSGYFIIRGEPGIGKSALMAKLVKEWRCVHHFNIALQNINTPKQFLANICAQLILRFRLPHTSVPQDAWENGAFLNKLLQEASEKLTAGEKLVIAVDALDEVDRTGPTGVTNILYLPPNLPAGVYIVVTTRPFDQLRLVGSRVRPFDVHATSDGNVRDIGAYTGAHLDNPGIKTWMDAHDVKREEFVDLMLRKSEGNFMYLHHVLPALGEGRFQEFNLDDLPDGLLGYYRQHWSQMQRQDGALFDRLYKPVVCVLAAAKEAVTAEQVAEWTTLEGAEVRRVLRDWREFLYEERHKAGPRLFRVYHTTFREFLQEDVDPGLKTYHAMIARRALAKVANARKAQQ